MPGVPTIEILTFDGCPNGPGAVELVRAIVAEGGVDVVVTVIDVPDADAAVSTRFLGSPTVRVNGHDVEPGAEAREDFALACRVYRTEAGTSGQPDERWIREAVLASTL